MSFLRTLRQRVARISLRRRLVVVMIVLAGVGLIVSNVFTYTTLSSFLSGRVDDQLEGGLNQAWTTLAGHPFVDTARLRTSVSPDIYLQVLDAQGNLVVARPSYTFSRQDPTPALPSGLPIATGASLAPVPALPSPTSFESSAQDGSGTQYRSLEAPLPQGGAVVVSASLEPMNQTLSKLVRIELIVTASVLVALIIIGLWLVRLGLRPLDDIGETAGRIAAGDLSERVSRGDPRTEVGRLSEALNAMLSQIERAFAERRASEERLRQFIADASHELRTPLTSIRGYAELFRRGAGREGEGLERAMGRIEGEAHRMSSLVDDLLLLARLDQGRPLELRPVHLDRLATDAVTDARVVAPDRRISLEVPSSVVVEGDADRLRQVVANLLSNAVAHTPPRTPVHVAVTSASSRGILEVADEGPGLQPDQAARVFERFYRADPARSRGGSGLGLSIVAAIANAHHGRATVRSSPGSGATFRVEIPLSAGAGNGTVADEATQPVTT